MDMQVSIRAAGWHQRAKSAVTSSHPMTEGEIAATRGRTWRGFRFMFIATIWRVTELRHSTGRHSDNPYILFRPMRTNYHSQSSRVALACSTPFTVASETHRIGYSLRILHSFLRWPNSEQYDSNS